MSFGLERLVVLLLFFGLCWATLDPHDPVVVGKTFMAASTDPREGSTAWALTSHGIAEKLFTVDKHGDIVGQVAESVNKVSELVWEVTLKSGYKFSDGTAVNAQHVAACLTELNTMNPSAQSSLGSMTVTAPGDLKVRIQSERATHVMDAVLAEWVFVVYFAKGGDFVFTGPYAVKTFVAGDHIDLVPNQYYNYIPDHYYSPEIVERPRIVVKKFSDGHELAKGVKNNEVDVGFHLPIDTLSDLRKADGIRVTSFEVGYHYMMFHNMDKLDDVRVRKAIDLAIDRNALSEALAGGKPTRSLFPDYTPYFSDTSSPAGDSSAAATLLDEAGWTLSNGKRMKNGQELTINLVAYPHRPGLVIMQPVIAQALTDLGITVTSTLTGDDWSETAKIISDRSFDLLMWAQNTLPAGDPLWFLSAFFRSDGGNNHAGLGSATVDSLLDALSVAEDHQVRVAATAAAHKAILDEVPVSNLVTPYWHVGLSDRVRDYEPWGSDYYVIRPDFFATKPLNENCQQLTVDFILTEGEAVLSAIEDDIRMDLYEVGIHVNTRTLPKDSWNTAAQSGDFNMAFSETWGPPYDPHSYAKSWLVPDEAHYAALKGLLHPLTQEALGQKIDSVLTSTNEKARQSLWRDILSRLHDQAIDLPISGKRIPAVINKNRLSGYVPGHQQFDYPVHNLQVVSGSKTITVAPGAQTGLFQGVGRLDPHTYRPNEFFSNNWVYEGLVEYGLDGAILPSLATHWTIADTSDGGQEYTFHLRQGVTFHDGEQWNCAAAKLNFDHVLAKPLTTGDFHGWYGLPEQVSNWVCKSTYELVVTTKTKYYPLLQEMCYIRPLRFLSPAKFVGGASSDPLTQNSCHGGPFTAFGPTVTCAGIQAPAGTGRWRYDQTTKKTDGTVQEVIFQRNTAHWAPASGDVETLRLVHYDSHDAVKAALVDGTLDLVVGGGVLNPKDVREFRTTRAADFDVVLTEPLQNRIVILNSAKAPTNDVQVRKTIMHAVNKAAIIEKELFGLADPVDTLFPKTAPYCHLDLTPRWDFDLEKAHFLNCQSTSPCTCNCNCNVQNTPPSSGNSDVVAPPGGGASGVVINMYNSGGCPGTS